MEEAPKSGEGPTPPPRKNPNAAVFCSCRKPASLVIVPTSYMPGQRCWRCANPDVQCGFCHWHGPWINERNNIRMNEMDRNLDLDDDDRTDEQSCSSGTGTGTGTGFRPFNPNFRRLLLPPCSHVLLEQSK